MSDRFGELQTLVQGVAVNGKWTHCLIHREALVSQQLRDHLSGVLEVVAKTVNFIKARPLKARLFQCLCDELGADHNNLLQCKVAFQRQSSVTCVRMRNEIFIFLKEENHALPAIFENEVFLT